MAARTVAEYLGTDHHEIDYRAAEALESLPDVVRAIESFDPGLVRSAVPNFMLARMTRQHVKVVLTGEGADELFAGYDYLREFTEPDDLRVELERTVRSLHNLNLQRCDRVTMAHGLEARVPFLDREVIEWALRLPPEAKIARPGEPEKKLLREAFDGWLPDELLWREKAEFGDGSGARDVLSEAIEADISDEEFAAERDAVDPPLRTKEELAYYRVWREHLAGHQPRAHAQPLRPRVAPGGGRGGGKIGGGEQKQRRESDAGERGGVSAGAREPDLSRPRPPSVWTAPGRRRGRSHPCSVPGQPRCMWIRITLPSGEERSCTRSQSWLTRYSPRPPSSSGRGSRAPPADPRCARRRRPRRAACRSRARSVPRPHRGRSAACSWPARRPRARGRPAARAGSPRSRRGVRGTRARRASSPWAKRSSVGSTAGGGSGEGPGIWRT